MDTITLNITVPAIRVCDIRGREMPVDMRKAAKPEALAALIFDYGFRLFNDKAPNGMKRPEGEKTDAVVVRFFDDCLSNAITLRDKYLAGELERERAERGESADPVGVEARAIARLKFKGMDDQKRKALLTQVMAKYKEDEKLARKRVVGAWSAKPDVRAEAEANVKRRESIEVDDIGADDI